MDTYLQNIHSFLQQIQDEEIEQMEKASRLIAETINNGGMIHLFGCGHSHLLAEDTLYRAGGLAAVRPILHEPLMLHEGAVTSSLLEKTAHYASYFMDKEDIREGDLVIVISTSGRNPVPIDVALSSKQAGAYVVGLTSKAYQTTVSRHPTGKLLFESVDLAIDNHVPLGDGIMKNNQLDTTYGPVSTVLGSVIINQLLVSAIEILIKKGITPPIFKSGNVDGADEHNLALIEKYKTRNPLLQ